MIFLWNVRPENGGFTRMRRDLRRILNSGYAPSDGISAHQKLVRNLRSVRTLLKCNGPTLVHSRSNLTFLLRYPPTTLQNFHQF